MPNVSTIISYGEIVLTVNLESAIHEVIDRLNLRYEIRADGIWFFNPIPSKTGITLFDLLDPIMSGRACNVKGEGSLFLGVLGTLPDKPFKVMLRYGSNDFTLRTVSENPFLRYLNLFFKNLDLQFTEHRGDKKLTVEGKVNFVLFESEGLLNAELNEQSRLSFRYRPELSPLTIEIAQLGRLDVTTLEVGTLYASSNGLQTLYTFNEKNGSLIHDVSGVGEPFNLKIEENEAVQWIEGGGLRILKPTLIHSKTAANNLIEACKASGEITLEAWVKPSNANQCNRSRIISLSSNNGQRNFTLSQDSDKYIFRLRTTQSGDDGMKSLETPDGLVKSELLHLVYSRSQNGKTVCYVNSNEVASQDILGNFCNWDNGLEFALANELTKDRPWLGEYHLVAIYNRALSAEEVNQNFHRYSYLPGIIRGNLKIADVPKPLDEIPVEIQLFSNQSLIKANSSALTVTPNFRFDRVDIAWMKKTDTLEQQTGKIAATLWDNSLEFEVTLPPRPNQPIVALKRATAERALTLKGLGSLSVSQLDLYSCQADVTVWNIRSNARAKLTAFPPPLKEPLPARLFIDAGKLWLGIESESTLSIVEQLAFDRIDLRFTCGETNWQVQGNASIRLFGESLPLTAQFIPEGATSVLMLERADLSSPISSPEQQGRLAVSRIHLKAIPQPEDRLWNLELDGYLQLASVTPKTLAGLIKLTAIAQIEAKHADCEQRKLTGQSTLTLGTIPIFLGNYQMQGDRFFMAGKLTLLPGWSALQVSEDAQIEIDANGRMHIQSPVQVTFADFSLLEPQLALETGALTLAGNWLGESICLSAIDRQGQVIWQGKVSFEMPFSLSLGPLYEPQTQVKLADRVQVCQEPDCWQVMHTVLDVELSAAGFLARVQGTFPWQDETLTVHEGLSVPEISLFAPPVTRNAILEPVLRELKANANEVFASRFKHRADYFFTASAETTARPLICYGDRNHLPDTAIETILPGVFNVDSQQVANQTGIFQLIQETATSCQLRINLVGKSPGEIETGYMQFLEQLATTEQAKLLLPGAARVIQKRIAERLPMPLDRVLYYYYNFNPAEGYLDLQEGMRLRVDYQNYQDVPATDRTTTNGFVGSGTSYYQVTSYLHLTNAGAPLYLLGFDPFVSRVLSHISTDVSRTGAGGILDLLKPGFRQPYYRLFYPSEFSGVQGSIAPERAITIAGATQLAEMAAATQEYQTNGSVTNSNSRVSFFFRGRVVVIPEITVFVQEQPVMVSLGTTLRQLIERYAGIPSASLRGQDLQAFQGRLRPRRLVHEGVNNTPSYRFINLESDQTFANGMDLFDLPVVKGDRFYF
ncbi:hypothetical protein NIES2107_74890 (plasmid) [Nostoc carneum NIES-2107]|nr:hypothetical protein NIES2107_74890 [Nostoc carneum NIES-2107]